MAPEKKADKNARLGGGIGCGGGGALGGGGVGGWGGGFTGDFQDSLML